MVASWKERVADAHEDGYQGLSATADMTWALSWGLDSDVLIEYERIVETAFAGGHLAGLCQYDRRRFESDTLQRAGHVHRYAMDVGGAGVSINYNRLRMRVGRELELGGEIDLANVRFLDQQLMELLAEGDAVADCSELTFIDARGCRVLHDACDGHHGRGRLELRNTPEAVARVMHVYHALEEAR
jgi:anti-anti-sigma factor